MLYDVVIIGGGPAGLTAGLYTSRAKLKTLAIEKGLVGGQVTTTEFVENYPGFEEGITGAELSMKMEKQAKRFGLEIIQASVREVLEEGRTKKIFLEGSEEAHEAKSLIIATGAHPKLLNIPGEDSYRGKGVSYCATCDGAFFKGERIAVVGGGDSAVQEGIFLTKFGEKVYIIHRRDKLRAEKILQERAFGNSRIQFVWDTIVQKIEGDDTVSTLRLKNVKTGEESSLDVQGVFIYIGYNPNTEIFGDLLNLDQDGFIITDEAMATSAPGVFAAGDVRSNALKQISTAVGDGAKAAIGAEHYIEENFNQ
jgi:thioredoxin reductase (NADPH)